MKKYLSAFMIAGMAICMQQAQAQGSSSSHHHKVVKKAPAKKAEPVEKDTSSNDEDDKEPDINGSATVEYSCELGNKITIYQNDGDDKHIALRWKHRLHRMTRVDTSTGANRFENRRYGLVWIGIPAKGMLLDSKKGHQLANECKSVQS